MEELIEDQRRRILNLKIEKSKLTTDEDLENLDYFLNDNTTSFKTRLNYYHVTAILD